MRSASTAISIACVAALVASGCQGKPDPGDAVPSRGPGTVATAVPATPAPPGAQVSLPTRDQVTAALLATTELPGTYAPAPFQNSPAGQMGAGVEGCGGSDTQPQPSVQSTAVYQGGVAGPFVAETITVAEGAATVRMMAALRAVTRNCSRFGGDVQGGGMRMEVAIDELTFPRVGDEVVAFRLTGTIAGAGAAVFAHVVTTRIGRTAVTVILMQLASPDVAATEAIVRPAVDKAGRLLPK